MVRIPTQCEPTHPGEMLLEEFLTPMGMTQRELADAIYVPYQRINEIINRRRGISPGTALRLAKFFRMTPGFWMNVQLRWDLYQAQKKEEPILETIRPYSTRDKGSREIQPPSNSRSLSQIRNNGQGGSLEKRLWLRLI